MIAFTIQKNVLDGILEGLRAVNRNDLVKELTSKIVKVVDPTTGMGVTIYPTIHIEGEPWDFATIQATLETLPQLDQDALYNGITAYGLADLFLAARNQK